MEDDDFKLDNGDDLDESRYDISPLDESDEDDDESENENQESDDGDDGAKLSKAEKEAIAEEAVKHMTEKETWLENAYDELMKARSKSDTPLNDVVMILLSANPAHTSMSTKQKIAKEVFQAQGHNRLINSIYTSDTPLRGADVEIELDSDNYVDSTGFNSKFTDEAREQIARFVDYLASRDLSKETINSRKRKEKQLPAFIIFMFSSGMYDLIINCPTMPEEYAKQIDHAMKKITESKYDVVEALAIAYEEAGRQEVADKVRQMQLAWFTNEPAQIRSRKEFRHLDLTYDDVLIYKKYRSRWVNISKSITQETISDLIEVVEDKDAGIYYKLKDKTRTEAVVDVKRVYDEWLKNNSRTSDLAEEIKR